MHGLLGVFLHGIGPRAGVAGGAAAGGRILTRGRGRGFENSELIEIPIMEMEVDLDAIENRTIEHEAGKEDNPQKSLL